MNEYPFRSIWAVDFEFTSRDGERPNPICLVARELREGRVVRLCEDELRNRGTPPYPTDGSALFVAYYASAELGCHLALGWPLPENVLDLFAEFRCLTNGRDPSARTGLLDALQYFGIQGASAEHKEFMRALAMRGGPYTASELQALLTYCASDVEALQALFSRMGPIVARDLGRALLRGRYMRAVANIEHTGVPVDASALRVLRDAWPDIQDRLISAVDEAYGVYDGRSFRAERFEAWLIERGIAWPRLRSGRLALDDDTFRERARVVPELAPLRELRTSLSKLRLADIAVGSDARNRCLLSAFRARTGRNAPSTSRFIFGPATWIRGLIRPEPGYGLAYIDWAQQEFGIAAALSGDASMLEAYRSGDPYLAFAKQAGAVPPDATKETHGAVRDQFKACALAVLYGMGVGAFALRLGTSHATARELLDAHRRTYRTFWGWSDAAVDHAMLYDELFAALGWTIHVGPDANPRSLRNFPMQANGAEMLRLACCLATEQGVRVCAPVHDALLIEAANGELTRAVEITQRAMAEASDIVLAGFELRSDARLVRYPERYLDPRGKRMWETVWRVLRDSGSKREVGDKGGSRTNAFGGP